MEKRPSPRQRVMIAGGTKGIGFHLAMAFVAQGANVAVCGRDSNAISGCREALANLADSSQRIDVRRCDLSDQEQLAEWASLAIQAIGGLNTLICTATGQATGNSEDDWKKSIDVDLMAPVRLMEITLPYLSQGNDSSILLVASRTALEPAPRYTAYAAVKAAIVHLTMSKAATFARMGIRVNCVAPGSTEYPGGLWEQTRVQQPEIYSQTLASLPQGRLAIPDDIVPPMLFLCSPAARWITGQTLLVDGGQTLGT